MLGSSVTLPVGPLCFTPPMEFAYLVRPAFDRDFLDRATEDERAVVEQHRQCLEARYADGRLRFAGRCDSGPFALVVVTADDQDEARRLTNEDPSVRSGVQQAELHPFRTFLSRERGPDG
ncbi:MAG: YciI family protein [Actinomycetes bacterium]